jgi:hypothetical protein
MTRAFQTAIDAQTSNIGRLTSLLSPQAEEERQLRFKEQAAERALIIEQGFAHLREGR